MSTQDKDKVGISVLIVDDHPSFRAGLHAILDKTSDIHVIGETDNHNDAKRLLDKFRPKIILLDLKLPGFSPLLFERWVRENYPETITLVLTAHDRDVYLSTMLDAGIAGFFDKKIEVEQLIKAIRRASSGEYLITLKQMTRTWVWRKEAKKWDELTKRESEVLSLIAQGLSNKAIAKKMSVKPKTVAFHVTAILDKLEVETRYEAVMWYQKIFPENLE